MSERRISEKSLLKILRKSNQESNLLTREAIETALLQLLEKRTWPRLVFLNWSNVQVFLSAAFYRNYDSKEEILESVFKRTVHNIMEQLHHYDLRDRPLSGLGSPFREARKEARVIQLGLRLPSGKIFVQAMQEFLEKYHGKSKVSALIFIPSGARPSSQSY